MNCQGCPLRQRLFSLGGCTESSKRSGFRVSVSLFATGKSAQFFRGLSCRPWASGLMELSLRTWSLGLGSRLADVFFRLAQHFFLDLHVSILV